MLRRMHCIAIFALLATSQLPKVDCDVTGVEWFPFLYDHSKFISIPLASGVTLKCADGTVITEGGYGEFRPISLRRSRIARCLVFLLSGHGNYFLSRYGLYKVSDVGGA